MKSNEQNRILEIERLLAEWNDAPDDLPPGLMARVIADAEAVQPVLKRELPRQNILARVFETIGGIPAFGALVAASCVGFWIGISPPEGMMDGANILFDPFGAQFDEPAEVSGFGWDLTEG